MGKLFICLHLIIIKLVEFIIAQKQYSWIIIVSSMQIQLKKQSFHKQIKNQQRTHYFNQIRQAKIKQISWIQQLKDMSEYQIRNIILNSSNQTIAFDIVYSYLELHVMEISNQLSRQLTSTILSRYGDDQNALYCLCILVDQLKQQSLLQILHNLNELLIRNIHNANKLQLVTILVYKLFVQLQEKDKLKWLNRYYQNIVNMLGCTQVVLFLLAEVCRFKGFEISQNILEKVLSLVKECKNKVSFQKICQLINHVQLKQSIGLVMKWLTSNLQTQTYNQQILSICLNSIYLLLVKYGKAIILQNSDALHLLMIIAIKGWIQNKIIALRCICNLILQAQDNQIVLIINNYSICEAIALAFQLELSNEDIFNILACSSLLFKLNPESIQYFKQYGALKYIVGYSNSQCTKLREMSCLILDQNQNDYL